MADYGIDRTEALLVWPSPRHRHLPVLEINAMIDLLRRYGLSPESMHPPDAPGPGYPGLMLRHWWDVMLQPVP